jgi:hypothetical protein
VAHVHQPTVNPLPDGLSVLPVAGRSRSRAWWLVAVGIIAASVVAAVAMLPTESDSPDATETSVGNENIEDAVAVAPPTEEADEWTSVSDQGFDNLDHEIDRLMNELKSDQ